MLATKRQRNNEMICCCKYLHQIHNNVSSLNEICDRDWGKKKEAWRIKLISKFCCSQLIRIPLKQEMRWNAWRITQKEKQQQTAWATRAKGEAESDFYVLWWCNATFINAKEKNSHEAILFRTNTLFHCFECFRVFPPIFLIMFQGKH